MASETIVLVRVGGDIPHGGWGRCLSLSVMDLLV